jgi:hypothetical protein
MSLTTPHYLLVGGCSKKKKCYMHIKKRKEIFNGTDQMNILVSQLKNIFFFVLYDSNRQKWKNEDEYMKAKTAYIHYLVEFDIHFVEIATQEFIF